MFIKTCFFNEVTLDVYLILQTPCIYITNIRTHVEQNVIYKIIVSGTQSGRLIQIFSSESQNRKTFIF